MLRARPEGAPAPVSHMSCRVGSRRACPRATAGCESGTIDAPWQQPAFNRKGASMFTHSAAIYDAIYEARTDVPAAASKIHTLIQDRKRSAGNALLDVACGTGAHLVHLRHHY